MTVTVKQIAMVIKARRDMILFVFCGFVFNCISISKWVYVTLAETILGIKAYHPASIISYLRYLFNVLC